MDYDLPAYTDSEYQMKEGDGSTPTAVAPSSDADTQQVLRIAAVILAAGLILLWVLGAVVFKKG